jgi:hypothetical protein
MGMKNSFPNPELTMLIFLIFITLINISVQVPHSHTPILSPYRPNIASSLSLLSDLPAGIPFAWENNSSHPRSGLLEIRMTYKIDTIKSYVSLSGRFTKWLVAVKHPALQYVNTLYLMRILSTRLCR